MCTCTSCEYTDSFQFKGFAEWPKGEAKGPRQSNAEYASHASHVWGGVRRNPVRFEPGQPPIYPSLPGLVHPVAYNTRAIRWNARYGVKYVPEPEPVRKPTLLNLAQQLRAARRAERRAA